MSFMGELRPALCLHSWRRSCHSLDKEPGKMKVHVYYKNQLHLSLSDHGICTGHTSLQLNKVKVRDEGIYECFDVIPDYFVNLRVYGKMTNAEARAEGHPFDILSLLEDPHPTPPYCTTIFWMREFCVWQQLHGTTSLPLNTIKSLVKNMAV